MRAVVADADAGRRTALREELERHGHEVTEGADAGEVLRLAAAGASLVVLGPRVGADDAVGLCRALRARAEEPEPVIVVVGDEDELQVDAVLRAGATDVWPVPGAEARGVGVRLALARHYARLQAENLRVGGEFALMRQALDLTGTGFVLTDPRLDDNPIVYANASFVEMTGFPREEAIGRNCRFLQGPDSDPAELDRLRRAIAADEPVTVELVNHRRDGTPFVNEVHVAPVRDAEGRVVRFVGVQVDVTAYRAQERRFRLEQEARRAAEAAERRSSFLAAASPTLDATLDLRATLDSLARLSVPHLADVCLVETVEGASVRRVATSAADPALERLLRELDPGHDIDLDGADPLARTLRQRRAEVVDEAGSGAVVGPAVHEVLTHRLGSDARQWMLVPLLARGRSIGVLALCSTDPGRRFGLEDLALAEDLAGRASLALDNARLYEQQVEIARVLQQSFLPDRLPDVPGIELVSRFRPADVAVDIGGDFYDVVRVPGGGTAIAVGDVTGKGAAAAALTGLCRHTLRAAWLYEGRPELVLRALNRVLVGERRERGRYATAAVCVLTPQADGVALETACAGHPAPRILRRDGRVDVVGARGTILGWREDLEIRPVAGHLAPGDTLVLYTDGVSSGNDGGPLSATDLDEELRGCAGLATGSVVARVQAAALAAQRGRASDDVVIVAARAGEPEARAAAVA